MHIIIIHIFILFIIHIIHIIDIWLNITDGNICTYVVCKILALVESG